jgi:hypothetical protein
MTRIAAAAGSWVTTGCGVQNGEYEVHYDGGMMLVTYTM